MQVALPQLGSFPNTYTFHLPPSPSSTLFLMNSAFEQMSVLCRRMAWSMNVVMSVSCPSVSPEPCALSCGVSNVPSAAVLVSCAFCSSSSCMDWWAWMCYSSNNRAIVVINPLMIIIQACMILQLNLDEIVDCQNQLMPMIQAFFFLIKIFQEHQLKDHNQITHFTFFKSNQITIIIIQLMASRYIQKYPIPQDFPSILKNFTREILRDQPSNIIEYSAKYFQALEKGQVFAYKSAYNIPKADKKYQISYDGRKAQQIKKRELAINKIMKSDREIEQERVVGQLVVKLFGKYDKNKNGTLQRKQIKEMLKQQFEGGAINRLPSDDEISDFFRRLDENGNGVIDQKEMTQFMIRACEIE